MDSRTHYLLQILETIGSPLMGAIVALGDGADDDAQKDAQFMAALLGKTVEASIGLGEIMDINPAEAQDDTLRVALAGLAGPLVAGQFSKRGRVPEARDIKKMTNALQAVLTFSDNFTPTGETVQRLKNLEASGQIVDTYQTQIQYMQAFIPVIEAIAAFPFGQTEAKLIMDVSDRLVKKSVELREALLPNVGDEAAQKRVELGLLKALAELYSVCHKAETEKVLKAGGDAPAGGLSVEPVWAAFDVRAAMLEALADKMVPGGGASKGVSPVVAAVAAAAVEAPPPVTPVAVAVPPPVAPVETPPAEQPPAGGSPMSMFAAPKADGAETPPPAAPVTPPAAPVVPPETPATPPAEAATEGNPMSMFAKPKDDETAETPAAPVEPVAPVADVPAAPPPPPVTPEQPPADPPETPPPAGGPMSFFTKSDDAEE